MSPKKSDRSNGGGMNKSQATRVITEPSARELRPTAEAREELQRLLSWEKRSEKRDWVVGRPFK